MEMQPSVIPIPSPWRATLLEAVKRTQNQLFLVCPYIKEEVISMMRETLNARGSEQASPLVVRVLTRVLAEEFFNGSSDIDALQQLLHWPDQLADATVELRAINNIHAKVWIFDDTFAIVGSGNVTPSGLDANLEYGLAVSDPRLVARIQQDWEYWWQRAEPVKEEQLDRMKDWLEQNRKLVQPLMAQVEEKRKEIERRIGGTPRIGKRLAPSPRNRQVKQARVAETSASFITSIQPEIITLAASRLSQALRWVSPPLENNGSHHSSEAFMKLACTTVSPNECILRCVWADGKRFSQATIPVHSVQQSWTLTLDTRQISILQHLLNLQVDANSGQDEVTLHYSEEKETGRLHIIRRYAENIVGEINIAGSLTNPPSQFPRLRSPLSKITLEHHQLLEILTLIEQHTSSPPAHILMSLEDISGTINMRLTIRAFESTSTLALPGTDSTLIGPSLSLNLDYNAFYQVLTGAPAQITTWQINIDRDATAVQFVPRNGENVWQHWKHQLWHREN